MVKIKTPALTTCYRSCLRSPGSFHFKKLEKSLPETTKNKRSTFYKIKKLKAHLRLYNKNFE